MPVLTFLAAIFLLLFPPPVHSQTTPINDTPITRTVFLLIFNPLISSSGNQKLTLVQGWNDPDTLTASIVNAFPDVSHGYLSYQITGRQEADYFPIKASGYQFTDAIYPACLATDTCNRELIDYPLLFTQFNLCQKNVDEIWLWAGPWMGFLEYNPVGYCGKTTFVMGFSYERGLGEAIHDFGHRMEFIGATRAQPEWNKFVSISDHCGLVHYPPGTIVSVEEYIYDKLVPASSDCNGYLNYPLGPFPVQSFNCTAWNCSQEGFLRWWLTHVPHNSGRSVFGSTTLYHNWWKYYAFYDQTLIPPPPLPGDANRDCRVSIADYVILLNHYGQTTNAGWPAGDFNNSGTVTIADYVILLNHYGQTC